MSDGFLKRWSRRKRAEPPPSAAPVAVETDSSAAQGSVAEMAGAQPPNEQAPALPAVTVGPDEDEIDPSTLPPIESLGPDSDYTVFMRKGVPEALRMAALRRAWMSDPMIRDFRSPAIDYGWDFTTPDYALRPTDDVAKMLDQIFAKQGEPAAAAGPEPAAAASPAGVPVATAGEQPEQVGPSGTRRDEPSGATVASPECPAGGDSASPPERLRRHGGALPS